MSVSIEKIDLLKERTNVSYSEAQEVLQKFDGNVVEALIYLESANRTNTKGSTSHTKNQAHTRENIHHDKFRQHKKTFKKVLSRLHATHLLIKNDKDSLINLPLTIALPLVLFTLPISIFVLIGVALTGHKIAIVKPNGINFSINQVVEFVDDKDKQTE